MNDIDHDSDFVIDPGFHEPPPSRRRRVSWPVIILGALAVAALAVAAWVYVLAPTEGYAEVAQSPAVVLSTPTPPATPSPTSLPTSTAATARAFTFLDPTATPTTVPGGAILVFTPEPEAAGWVVSDDESIASIFDPQNHFGDSFLYAGSLDGKTYNAAFQFDLSLVPRGTQIHSASLRLTGIRSDQLNEANDGQWQLHLLPPEMDYRWPTVDYQQIHDATPWISFEPALTQQELGAGRFNQYEFSPEQIALLEQHLLEGSGKISFRLDGPGGDSNNLFAWDNGYAVTGEQTRPELFLSLGSPPEVTPPPHYVVITSTPTPENILTAAAVSLEMTAEAKRVGTATPLPPNWVTPVVVTATPTAANEATAQVMNEYATAIARTTGMPPNVVTATPTAAYVIITPSPTPDNVMTAAAISLQKTAAARQVGTATPLPPNWVTPVVVTSTPTPANAATAEYLWAVAITTGTPTPAPANMQTATATPAFVALNGQLPTPALTPTPTGTAEFIPSDLVGKIAFLSDRAYHANAQTELAEGEVALPVGDPLVYVMDPDGSNLALLSDRWPYDLAWERDSLSADQRFRALVRDAEVGNSILPVIFAVDSFYDSEKQVTHFGNGIAYDPAWSPVAEQIAFVSNDTNNDEIWVINHDGTGIRQLTQDQYNWWDKHPSWSPDGSKIVFWSNRTGNRSIWVMDADGGNLQQLSRTEYNDWNPVWIKYTDVAPPLPGE